MRGWPAGRRARTRGPKRRYPRRRSRRRTRASSNPRRPGGGSCGRRCRGRRPMRGAAPRRRGRPPCSGSGRSPTHGIGRTRAGSLCPRPHPRIASSDHVLDMGPRRERPRHRAEVFGGLDPGPLELPLVGLPIDRVRDPQPLHPRVLLEAVDRDHERRHRIALLLHQEGQVDGAATPEGRQEEFEGGEPVLSFRVDREPDAVAVHRRDGAGGVHGHRDVSIAFHGTRVPTRRPGALYPAGMPRFRRSEFEREEGLRPARFGAALLLIVASIFAIALSEDSAWLHVVALVLEATALLFILRTSDVHHRFLQVAGITVVASVLLASLVAIFGGEDSGKAATGLVGGLIAVGAPIAIIRRLARERVVDLQVLAGALCLYLLLGLFFTFIYSLIMLFDSGTQLFVQQPNDLTTTANITYFSYVTMTTVGYGDLTLSADVPRMFAVTEALMGQLYLVSAVALVVSRLGQERQFRVRGARPG